MSPRDRRPPKRSPRSPAPQSLLAGAAALLAGTWAAGASADLPVQSTFFQLASSNGRSAVMLDLKQAKLTHFREHLFAAEEPQLDGTGMEIWTGSQFASIATRGLLYDAYFGLRQSGTQAWLTAAPVDLANSGYASWQAGKSAGTGVVTMVQTSGPLTATQYFFAPQGSQSAGFVMAINVKNTGATAVPGVSVFSLHNFHMGYGRPGVMTVINPNGETVSFDGGAGKADLLEQGFAGVVVARALGAPAHHATSNPGSAAQLYDIVNGGGSGDFPDLSGAAPTADDSVSGYQWDFGSLAPGADTWAGVAFSHHGDPTAGATVQSGLDTYVGASGAEDLVKAEIAGWSTFQSGLTVPATLSADEETLLRQSAAMLAMGQVQDDHAFLRQFLTMDGEPRYTRFGTTLGGPVATLPNTIAHRAKGAVIASLPPGEWTVAWLRDGSYAATAMASLGMKAQARAALSFYLGAEAGRFQSWKELMPYNVPPYLLSMVRYQGFGVEETDFNDFGPNLEFDGFGLFLWALAHYEALTGDTTLVDASWPAVSSKVADVLVALIDPSTGLLRPDSSIWETHWDGRQRTWTYTNITAARGLCDAATLATRKGDKAHATTYKAAALALREAIARKLTDPNHALASNAEELADGEGYWDAAVFEGIAMGLFDPKGKIAAATYAGIDAHLAVPAGAGWSRNDDRYDHQGATDLSPWGSEYDSAEWIFTDMRGAVATRLVGDTARSDRLLGWVRDQSLANYLAVSETYDETTGVYKFNAPMLGFGAGVYALALAGRDKPLDDAACGAYFDETSMPSSSSSSSGGGSSSSGGGGASASGSTGSGGHATATSGCGCRTAPASGGTGWAALALAAALGLRFRRRALR